MSDLRIDAEFRRDMKYYLLNHLRAGTPFQYLINLSRVGEDDYNVKAADSLEYGVNKALDYYNSSAKTEQSKFYGLLQGAEGIINYVDYKRNKE